jgi:hypothetical protein
LGLFASYDEKKHGNFQNAVNVCGVHEYVVWTQKAAVDVKRFSFPTTILIRIKGTDRYYRGELRGVKRAEEVDWGAFLEDRTHRPVSWQRTDRSDYAKVRSVLYIAELGQVSRPAGVAKDSAPQRPWYLEEGVLSDVPLDELEEVRVEKEREGAFSPSGLEDARKRIIAAIVVRQGQSAFRSELLAAYRRTCAVSGCNVVEALEAAHIVPYLGLETNQISNGLLLRADIHTLFDLSLIAVDPSDHRVLVSKRLNGRSYESLAGQMIRLPANQSDHPSREALERQLAEFRTKEGG